MHRNAQESESAEGLCIQDSTNEAPTKQTYLQVNWRGLILRLIQLTRFRMKGKEDIFVMDQFLLNAGVWSPEKKPKVQCEDVVLFKKLRDTQIVTTVSRHQFLQGLIAYSQLILVYNHKHKWFKYLKLDSVFGEFS